MGLFQLTYLKRSKIKYCATDFQWLKIPSLLIVTLIFFSESLFSNPADFSSGLNILGDLEGQQVPATIMKSIENGKPWVFMGDPIDRGPHSLEFIIRVAEQIENSASTTDLSKKIGENTLNELSCSSGCYSVFFSKPYTVADNRGTNKLRLLFELTSESLKKPPRNSSWKDFFDFVKEK
ncbi:MAG: hypothetical protein L6Q37_07605, partial [Bdellovibrionaceae bacterium]|nr:hypothetical protein [Pseudobdellovibrionaceae bacterium]